ncbi:MAG: 4Fe-4S dicluster domain-containing protein [Promethearchaeota archaeon]
MKEASETTNTYIVRVNGVLCEGCGVCVEACPINFTIKRRDKVLDESNALLIVENGECRVLREELCDGCGVCMSSCPPKAISIQMKALAVGR